MSYIDLHTHTNASDGSLTPEALVRYAVTKDLCVIAVTDHDTTAGLDSAIAEAEKINAEAGETIIRVIPGIEVSATYKGKDVHILGYQIDYHNADFQHTLQEIQTSRVARNQEMMERICKIGFTITEQELRERFGDAVITRAHYAICMVERGFVSHKDQAFRKYLNPGCPCYVPKDTISAKDAIDLILSVNGKPVLAHPFMYKLSINEIKALVADLKDFGIMGLEAIHSANKWNEEMHVRQMAKQHGLFITGGTDYHGAAKPTLDLGVGYGKMKISAEILLDAKL